jgi:hypothetical protein
MAPWQIQGPSSSFPCASVSSFGFGGTNGHVVLAATAIRAEKKGPRFVAHLSAGESGQMSLHVNVNQTTTIHHMNIPEIHGTNCGKLTCFGQVMWLTPAQALSQRSSRLEGTASCSTEECCLPVHR